MKDLELPLLDRITDAFAAFDADWRFVFVNQKAAELLERERLDLLGKQLWNEFPALVSDPFGASCRRAMEQQVPLQIERYSTRLGRWIENRLYPSLDGMTILFTDITERKEQEMSLRQYQDIFRFAEVGLVLGTGDGATLGAMNPAFAHMHGYEVEELQGRPVRDVYAPEERSELPWLIRRTEEIGHHVYESRHVRKDGTTFPVCVDTTAVKDAEGRVLYRIVNVTDVSSRREVETALQESVFRLETLIASLQTGVLVEDSQGQIVLANQALCDMIGLWAPPYTLIGAPMAIFVQRVRLLFADANKLLLRLADLHGRRQPFRSLEMNLMDGRVFEMDYTPVFSSSDVGCHLWQLRDVTDRRRTERHLRAASAVLTTQKRDLELQKQKLETANGLLEVANVRLKGANAQLEALATTDGLTGLLNHRMFELKISEEFLRARRYGEPLCLILLDVDHFKDYNDTFGHLEGNRALMELAQVLRACVHEPDSAFRFGGEEFAVLLPHTKLSEAVLFAEQVRASVATLAWERQAVTVSLGICETTRFMEGPNALIAGADAALYRAKAEGRNRIKTE